MRAGSVDDGGPSVGLEELYATHRLSLVRLALLLVDDVAAAEDVVHDAFARMVARRTPLRDPHAALGYLRTSVVNGSRSALRRRRTARAYAPPLDVAPTSPEDSAVLAEEHRAVLDGLARLGRRQREVLVLRYWSGLSEADIAATLGISRGTVKSTASRALVALERVMTQEADR
ncbi:SigE family RNA polymerase sigma factor [uncultured Nocardioides sp.]|uniref:SigE family RNA polymerase sigma factor n=1 Tax=uncultured Nocardioides sp. TaxID=198441 RepID=UPI002629CC70|nr:SigE family RNA polymerase sigma factor [uncultured Nocardioides sp.]